MLFFLIDSDDSYQLNQPLLTTYSLSIIIVIAKNTYNVKKQTNK